MAPPIYFLPKLSRAQVAPGGTLSRAVLAGRGLEQTFEDLFDVPADRGVWLFDLTVPGPGGQSGALLCALPYEQPPPPRLRHDPRFQTWEQLSDTLWVGTDNEHPPTPEDLRRRRPLLEGYRVRLAGHTWIVPVIRDPEGGSGLPRTWRYNGDGKIVERVEARYRDLWERGEQICSLLFGDLEQRVAKLAELGQTWVADRCCDALSLNYRFGRIEQNLLGLISSETWASILGATVDYLTFQHVVEQASAAAGPKKNGPDATPASTPAPQSTSPGPEDDYLATARAAES